MDDHHPAGFKYPGPLPSFICRLPLDSLSMPILRNIENLFFAGRNISVTHAAMSATGWPCAILGQAVGTAAAIAVRTA